MNGSSLRAGTSSPLVPAITAGPRLVPGTQSALRNQRKKQNVPATAPGTWQEPRLGPLGSLLIDLSLTGPWVEGTGVPGGCVNGPVTLPGSWASSLPRLETKAASPSTAGSAGSWERSEADLDRGFLSRFLHTSCGHHYCAGTMRGSGHPQRSRKRASVMGTMSSS